MQKDEIKAADPIRTDISEIPQPEAKVEPVFGVRIGTMGILVSTSRFCEVLDKSQVNVLPNVHPWISGIVNLRGNLVPVFDLRVVLEEGAGDSKKRRLFAVDRDDKAIALWIDNYPEIKNRAAMHIVQELPKLPPVLQRFVTNGYELDGLVWLDIKFEELFKSLGSHQ
ncbi:MAG: chemotaxis protein CheW [Methylococcaceae bacterium]|nr:chemotaxis protein CheW [Methylococcaceae bacterium]